MNRTTIAALGALLALGAMAAPAAAKQTRVTVSTPAAAPVAGVAWRITLHVTIDGRAYTSPGYTPTVDLLRRGRSLTSSLAVAIFHGARTGPGTYAVALVFPSGGVWSYRVADPVMGDWYFDAPHVAPRAGAPGP